MYFCFERVCLCACVCVCVCDRQIHAPSCGQSWLRNVLNPYQSLSRHMPITPLVCFSPRVHPSLFFTLPVCTLSLPVRSQYGHCLSSRHHSSALEHTHTHTHTHQLDKTGTGCKVDSSSIRSFSVCRVMDEEEAFRTFTAYVGGCVCVGVRVCVCGCVVVTCIELGGLGIVRRR